jgi:hypothetical protein
LIKRDDDDQLVFVCDACDEPVTGNTGYVHISWSDIAATEEAAGEWKQKHPEVAGVLELTEYPDRAPWRVHHADCDPRPEAGDYWFYVGRCDTWPKLTHWTAHLMEKNWLEYTTWRNVLEAIGQDA